MKGNNLWSWILAGASLVFFAGYLLSGVRQWGWLFPACIFGGTVVTLFLVQVDVNNALVMFAIALPFFVVFLTNRQRKWALVPAMILAFVGLIPLLTLWSEGDQGAGLVLMVIAMPFLLIALLAPRQWWAIIPRGVLASIAVALVVSSLATGFYESILMNGIMFLGWG